MRNPIRLPGSALAVVVTAAALTRPAAADTLAYAAEVDTCLAAVNERVVRPDAERVRHLVTDSRRTAIGYALTIETSVFSADREQRYAVRCVARGRTQPLKLEIEAIET